MSICRNQSMAILCGTHSSFPEQNPRTEKGKVVCAGGGSTALSDIHPACKCRHKQPMGGHGWLVLPQREEPPCVRGGGGNDLTPGDEGMASPTAPPSLPGQPRMSDNTVAASLLGCSAIVLETIASGPGFVCGCQPKLLTTGAALEGHPREG